ncbi:tyrosine-type recombinase/integrase [Halobaculum magnesiiphilum]|uniref:Site-specific integrase n=1 Tax=Halobaculum magnesiiphilum TaxID=1017351 RepID=A0A8T8WB56_9EURY|nr:site-specific integrase [Halobaculum magnesiiphilum]QZP37066.1 site-specific integrase [Halobaculum magnesiiphilum]
MAWTREPLTEPELDDLLDAADGRDLDHQVTIYTLAHTGLRADELAHLRDDWIDWQAERLRVPPAEGEWTPKTEHSARTIPLKHPGTVRRLRDYFSYHEAYDATRQTVTNRVKRVAAETDLRKKITPHVLRHTYGTLIAARGATPQYIRQTMGHADLSSANDYLQYAGTQLDAEAEELW